MLLPPWEQRVIRGAAHAADEERGIPIACIGVGVAERVLGPGGVAAKRQDITGVLGFVVDLPDIHSELHGMRAGHLGDAALELISVGEVIALAATQAVVHRSSAAAPAIEVPPAEIYFVLVG